MNSVLLTIILVPIVEIYLFIKIGGQIGAFNTISLVFITAIVGIIYARYEGLNTLKSGISQLVKNELPAYEIVSGATIALAAVMLIIPGFATDTLGFLLLLPLSRKLILGKFFSKFKKETTTKKPYIEGEFEDIEDDHDKKYKILTKYIKDMSSETPDIETFLYVKDNISKYHLSIDITSKPLKDKLVEINTTLKFEDKKESKKKSFFEIVFSTVIKVIDEVKEKKNLKKLFFVMFKKKFIQISKHHF